MIPDKPGYWWYLDSGGKGIANVYLFGCKLACQFHGSEPSPLIEMVDDHEIVWLGPVVDPHADVVEFHQAMFPHLIATVPAIPANPIAKLRLKLIEEEYREMVAGLDAGDMVEIVDGALDLIYVVLGMLVSYGVNPWPIWQEVQRSNMAKALGPIRDDGKKLKPPGWTPPDVVGELIKQGWDGGQPR